MKSIDLLKSEKYLALIALLMPKTHSDVARLSLFERFCLLCNNSRYLKQTLVYSELSACISDELGRSVELGDLSSREAQKAVWRALVGIEALGLDLVRSLEQAPACAKKIDGATDIFSLLRYSKYEDSEELFENVANDSQAESLLLDLGGLDYCRPDPYHSAVSYEKLRNGEELEPNELSALLCWSVCRILMRRNMELCVKALSSSFKPLLKLLDSRNLFPMIVVCVESSDDSELDALVHLCFEAQGRNIFFACKKNEVQSKLLSWLPSDRIFDLE